MAILIKFTSNEQFFIKQVLKKARAYAGYMNWRYDSERNYWCIFHVFFSPKSGFFYIEKWPVFGSDKFIIKVIHRSGKYGDLPHDEDKEIASFSFDNGEDTETAIKQACHIACREVVAIDFDTKV